MRLWLRHFNDFNTYIEFFCLEDFAKEVNGEYYPINIITGEISEPNWGKNGENPEVEISKEMDVDKIQAMLKRVNESVLKRSKTMAGKLK